VANILNEMVCSDINSLNLINPMLVDANNFNTSTQAYAIDSQLHICIKGINAKIKTLIKAKSATLSSVAPSSLFALLILLASWPSIMSVMAAIANSIVKSKEKGICHDIISNGMHNNNRVIENAFGKYLSFI